MQAPTTRLPSVSSSRAVPSLVVAPAIVSGTPHPDCGPSHPTVPTLSAPSLQSSNKGTELFPPRDIDICNADLHASCVELNELPAVVITPPIGTDLNLPCDPNIDVTFDFCALQPEMNLLTDLGAQCAEINELPATIVAPCVDICYDNLDPSSDKSATSFADLVTTSLSEHCLSLCDQIDDLATEFCNLCDTHELTTDLGSQSDDFHDIHYEVDD